MPAVFVGHGTPMLLDDAKWVGDLRAWAERLPRPKGILVFSAHWVADKFTVGTGFKGTPLLHDFKNLPPRYREVTYDAPQPRDINVRLTEMFKQPDGTLSSALTRGLDSGAYVPLVAMFPAADIPVVQIALPTTDFAALVELGQKLAVLRDEGLLLVGSGALVHNDRTLSFRRGEPPPPWAKQFDDWVAAVLTRRDAGELARYARAPGGRMAHPTPEHLAPVAVVLGASLGLDEVVTFPLTGFAYGSMSRRCVQFG